MDLLVYVVVLYIVLVIGITVYLVRWLEPLQHERYDGLHVYADNADGTRWHVQRPLLTLYMDIKDPRIRELTGQQPPNPKEIKLWTFTLGLPGLLSPVLRAFRSK